MGVKATMIPWTEPPMEIEDGRWRGPPGAFILGSSPSKWILCCPRCGELGSNRDGVTWQVTAGSFDDVATFSLTPSILKGCCGWHGYLTDGEFREC